MKVKYLLTEYVKNGVYHREYVPFTEEQINQMLKEETPEKPKINNKQKK